MTLSWIKLKKELGWEYLLVAAAFVSRLPFLSVDYGYEPDAFGHAIAAQHAGLTGLFTASRPPGHPILDFIYGYIWKSGPFTMNLLTAILGTLAVFFFIKIVKELQTKRPLFLAAAFAFIPIIFINCTVSMDYMLGEAFVLGSIYFALKEKSLLTGLFWALAISCRLTHLAMGLPLVLLLAKGNPFHRLSKTIPMALVGILLSAMTYIPFMRSGDFVIPLPEEPFTVVAFISLGFLHLWELLGLGALLLALIFTIYNIAKKTLTKPFHWHNYVWMIGILLYWVAFAKVPGKAAYLIPTIPFFLLILANLLSSKQIVAVCSLFIVSSLFGGIQHPMLAESEHPLFQFHFHKQVLAFNAKSPILLDQLNRKAFVAYSDKVIKTFPTLPQGTIVFAGWLRSRIIQRAGVSQPALMKIANDTEARNHLLFPNLIINPKTPKINPCTKLYYLKFQGTPQLEKWGAKPL